MGKKKRNPIEGLNQFRVDRMVTVTDDWYPNYPDNKVKLSIFLSYKPRIDHYLVRMCVWGADDTGMELDFTSRDYDTLKYHYDIWKKHVFDKVPDGVNMQWFFEHGFYPA